MYIHIGNDYVINNKELIGIFDINALKKTNSYDYIVDNLSEKVEDISCGKQRSLILIRRDNKNKGYISNILSSTISNRINN